MQGKVLDYSEHALNAGADSKAVSYIHLLDEESGRSSYGVGVSSNITRSSIRALFAAVNRLFYPEEAEESGRRRVKEAEEKKA